MRRGILLGVVIGLMPIAHSQTPVDVRSQYKVNYLTIDDGLSHGKVNTICRDKDGFLWFGTNEGLNRYDGYSMKIYKNDPLDSTSVTNNFVRSLLKDSHGYLWVGTFEGLCVYNYNKDNFTEIKFENGSDHREYVWKLVEDKYGIVWIATTEGLYYVEPKQTVATLFDQIPDLKERPMISYIFIDVKNNLLIASRANGLYFYNLDTKGYFLTSHDPDDPKSLSENYIETIFEDSQGTLWIGTNNAGINYFHYEDSSYTRMLINKDDDYTRRVRSIIEDRQGRIWIGTRSGLYLKQHGSSEFYHYAHTDQPASRLTNNSIYDIYIDEYDLMWIGTYAGGVNYIDFNQKKFLHFFARENDNRFLNNNIVYSIAEDKEGNLWIGTERGGLNFYNSKTGAFEYYMHDPKNSNTISSNNIKVILLDSIGCLWIGSYQGGLDYFNPRTKVFRHYVPVPDDQFNPYTIQEDRVYSLLIDSEKNLWLGMGSGIDLVPAGSKRFIHLVQKPDVFEIFEDNLVLSIYEDRYKNILVGTYGGLYVYNKKDTSFHSYRPGIKGIINTISEDRTGQLWIGGSDGLFYVSKDRDTVIQYTEQEGLPINTVYRIIDDSYGNLWISTSSGLSKFINGVNTPQIPDFRNYDAYDGLQSKHFINNSYSVSPSGKIHFGGINGFNSFIPEEIKDNPHKPKVVITNLKIFNKDVKVGEEVEGKVVLDQSITNTKKLVLSYRHYVFTLEFTSLHFAEPEKNQYKYMLEGFDEEWNITHADMRFATYTNLSRGEYTFKVLASNNDTEWSEEPTILVIKILPPFYKTWWFRITAFLVIVFSAVFFYLIRIDRLKKLQHFLEEKITDRTKDLKNANVILEDQKLIIAKSYDNIKLLSEIGQKLTSSLNLDEINKMIVEHVGALMDVSVFGIGIYNDNTKSIDFPQLIENGVSVSKFSSNLSDTTSAAAWCFIRGKPILCNNFQEEFTNYISELNIRTSQIPESIIYIPLIFEEKKIGVLTIQSYHKDSYSQNDFAILKTLALYIAIALNNANLYRTLEENNNQLEKQTRIVNEANTLLEERQQQIEEQAEELRAQKEELEHHQEKIIKQSKKLEEANIHLKELNSTKDKFFSIIAHDLKNPFQSIMGFAELLQKKYSHLKEEKRLKYVESINVSSKMVFRLLENLLDWARIQTGSIKFTRTEFMLSGIIKENMELMYDNAKHKNIELSTDCSSDFRVFADYEMVKTVVRNLLSNAIKFTSMGGAVQVLCARKMNFIEVTVKDTGVGLSDSDIKKIFRIDTSFTKKGTDGEVGTGLGLVLCKELIEKNEGKIGVKSELGKGSEFIFSIPAVSQ